MTKKEVTDLIKESSNADWFKEVSVKLNFVDLDELVELKGFVNIHQHFVKQKRVSDNIKVEIPEVYGDSEDLSKLERFLNRRKNSIDLSFYWNNIGDEIESKEFLTYNTTDFLIEINKDFVIGAYDYLTNKIDTDNLDANYMSGLIKAYEFKLQGDSNIGERREIEKKNIEQLKNEFKQFIETSNKEKTTFSNKLKTIIKDVNKKENDNRLKNNTEFKTWFDSITKKQFDSSKSNQKKFEDWFEKVSDNVIESNKQEIVRVKELEELYSDKLMLEKPAQYWNERAIKLKVEANKWLKGLIISIILAVVVLASILFFISTDTLEFLFSKTSIAIRSSIAFITLISFLAYAIRTFSKLAFSSYHLVRDAEERKQLVYVYLALKQKNAITDNERILILQSIFSRSDSGLLKEDSSPTMPSANIIEKIITSK